MLYHIIKRLSNSITILDESGTSTKTNSLHDRIFACLLILFYFPEIFHSLIPSEFQSVWIQIRSDILSGLIWVQTVCRRQKSSLAGQELHVTVLKWYTCTYWWKSTHRWNVLITRSDNLALGKNVLLVRSNLEGKKQHSNQQVPYLRPWSEETWNCIRTPKRRPACASAQSCQRFCCSLPGMCYCWTRATCGNSEF